MVSLHIIQIHLLQVLLFLKHLYLILKYFLIYLHLIILSILFMQVLLYVYCGGWLIYALRIDLLYMLSFAINSYNTNCLDLVLSLRLFSLGTTPLGFTRSWPRHRSWGLGDSTLTLTCPQGHTEWIEDFFHVSEVCIKAATFLAPLSGINLSIPRVRLFVLLFCFLLCLMSLVCLE